jgi:hypothetical protein
LYSTAIASSASARVTKRGILMTSEYKDPPVRDMDVDTKVDFSWIPV